MTIVFLFSCMFMLKWQVSVVILPRSTDGMVQVTSASKGKGTENINKHSVTLYICVCVQPCVYVCVSTEGETEWHSEINRDRIRHRTTISVHSIIDRYNVTIPAEHFHTDFFSADQKCLCSHTHTTHTCMHTHTHVYLNTCTHIIYYIHTQPHYDTCMHPPSWGSNKVLVSQIQVSGNF